MTLLGYDIGSSSIKASLVDAATGKCIAKAQYPDTEMNINAPKPGWAEQYPEIWCGIYRESNANDSCYSQC